MSMSMSLVEGASAHRSECNCKRCRVPTCTGSLILNQQVLLFLTSGLLQLALVAVVFAVGATNLQESQKDDDDNDVDFIETRAVKILNSF